MHKIENLKFHLACNVFNILSFVTYLLQNVVFFLFPQKNRGKNFGSKSGFDLPISKCSQTLKGLGVCLLTYRHHVRIAFTQNGKKALNFRREFTISAFVKTDWSQKKHSFIFGTGPTYAPRFMFRSSYAAHWKPTSLLFGFGGGYKNHAYTTHDNTDLYTWRHVAVVYNPHRGIKFYRNAKEWPLAQKLPANFDFVEPESISMFGYFWGFITLMAVVQKDVTESELGKLKDSFYI